MKVLRFPVVLLLKHHTWHWPLVTAAFGSLMANKVLAEDYTANCIW